MNVFPKSKSGAARFLLPGVVVCVCSLGAVLVGWPKLSTRAVNGGNGSEPNSGPAKYLRAARPGGARSDSESLEFPDRAKACRTRSEIESLLAEILSVPHDARFPGDGLDELFRRWFAIDPTGALAAVGAITQPESSGFDFRLAALKCGIEAYSSESATLDSVAAKCLADDKLVLFRNKLYEALGTSNPVGGMRLLESTAPKNKEDLFNRLCISWGEVSPRGVLGAIANFDGPDDPLVDQRIHDLLPPGLTIADAQWAKSEGLPEAVVAKVMSAGVRRAGRELEVNKVMELVEKGTIEPEYYGDLRQAVSSSRPKEFVANMEILEKAGVFVPQKDSTIVTSTLFQGRRASAFEFFDRLAALPSAQASAAYVLSSNLLSGNTLDCTTWISSLPPGQVRNAALKPLFAYLERHGEQQALVQWKALYQGE